MKTLEFQNYFMEPLRSMKKISTIRKSDKGLKEGDLVKCTFEWTDDYLIRRVRSVEKVKFCMIDEKLLLYFIKTRSREFEEQAFTIHKECTGSLRDMEYDDVIIHSINLYTLMQVTRILNELIEMIEEGKFNTSENSVSCCGGECGKQ